MKPSVQQLLQKATDAPWKFCGKTETFHSELWRDVNVFYFDEACTEPHPMYRHSSGSAYMYNNLEKTWNAVYGADGNKYLLYITCSTDCVWNGEENIVTVQPYGEDALQDPCDPFIHCIYRAWIHLAATELNELQTFLQDLLHRFVDDSQKCVPMYLKNVRFALTVQLPSNGRSGRHT